MVTDLYIQRHRTIVASAQ